MFVIEQYWVVQIILNWTRFNIIISSSSRESELLLDTANPSAVKLFYFRKKLWEFLILKTAFDHTWAI